MLVVLNPAAGNDDPESLRSRVLSCFAEHGVAAEVARVRSSGDLVELARRGVSGGARAVVAAGGDGTVSAVASVVAGTEVPLGVLPVGTLNHFARDLRLPAALEGAVATLAGGRIASVDVCEVNGRVFVNNSSLGLYPAMVEERESREQAGYGRWAAFAWALAAALRRYAAPVVRLHADGRDLVRRAPVLFVGNNLYQLEGLRLGSRRNLAAGQMCVYVLHKAGRLSLLGMAARALAGRLPGAPNFDALCVRELWIDSRQRQLRVALDGEVYRMTPPLHYRVRPGALRVLVPGD